MTSRKKEFSEKIFFLAFLTVTISKYVLICNSDISNKYKNQQKLPYPLSKITVQYYKQSNSFKIPCVTFISLPNS